MGASSPASLAACGGVAAMAVTLAAVGGSLTLCVREWANVKSLLPTAAVIIAAMAAVACVVDVSALLDMFLPTSAARRSPRATVWSVFRLCNWALSFLFALSLVDALRRPNFMSAGSASACVLLSYLFVAFSMTVLFRALGLRTATTAAAAAASSGDSSASRVHPAQSTASSTSRASAAALVLATGAAMPVVLACTAFVLYALPHVPTAFSAAALFTSEHALTLEAAPWLLTLCVVVGWYLRERAAQRAAQQQEATNTLTPLEQKRLESYPGVYPNGWFKLLYSEELKKGEVKHVEALGQNFAVFRGVNDDAAHVLDAYCPHLGANLAVGGEVEGDCLRCPFHRWSFRGDGSVSDIPYSPPGTKLRDSMGTHAWPCVEYYGMILVYFDCERRQPPYQPPVIADIDSGSVVHRGTYHSRDVRMHIQEFAENACDYAHFAYLHGDMMIPWTQWTVPFLKVHHDAEWRPGTAEEGNHISHFKNHAKLQIFGKEIPRTDGHADITMVGPCGVVFFVFDITDVGRIIMFQTHLPKNPMQLGTSFSWFAEPRIPRALVSYVVGNWVSQWANDLLVWENKMFARRPVLVKGDGPMGRVRAWYRQFYSSGAPAVHVHQADDDADDTNAAASKPASASAGACAAAGADAW